MDSELSAFYHELYQKPLAEPQTEKDVQNILSCILAQHGTLDGEDEALLQGTTSILHRKVNMIAHNSRKVLAQFTKAISSQLYDDPFRFFFELLQNADDAQYRSTTEMPAIHLTVTPTEIIVDLNEDGFSLSDVLSICSTGQSSKVLNEESTGEKGFGFKSVFGIAGRVHIKSGLWSFRFDHQRHEDGIGMISPRWEPQETIPTGVGTRFRLEYSLPDEDSLSSLCAWLEAQHPSMLFALRKIKKISICFQNTEGRNYSINFEKTSETLSETIIRSRVGEETKQLVYRTFTRMLWNMPKQTERPWWSSIVTIGLPVTTENHDLPHITPGGQYVLAYLPIVKMPQLPFVIQADFLLPGNRQAVSDNAWNRALRDSIARLFAVTIADLAIKRGQLGFRWPAYIPVQPMNGFWQPLQGLITTYLTPLKVFHSICGGLYTVDEVRVVPFDFKHDNEPLLPATNKRSWRFISNGYVPSEVSMLQLMGLKLPTFRDELDLLDDALSNPKDSKLRTVPLSDKWHDSFLDFIQRAMETGGSMYMTEIKRKNIIPVRVGNEQEWYKPCQTTYFPTVVDEGTGADRVHIEMPIGLGLVVLHPDAAKDSGRHKVYRSLGVSNCPPNTLCDAILAYEATTGTKDASAMLGCLQLLFWFSDRYHIPAFGTALTLVARSGGEGYVNTRDLFMRSQHPYHAERLLRLADHSEYSRHFLDESYQTSSVATRSRNYLTWEQWLYYVAGIRWYPPLNDGDKLHWIIETVRTRSPEIFVPLLQHYWSQEYGDVCRFHGNIKTILTKSYVLCQNGQYEELCKTWFPDVFILSTAQYYGIDSKLPILQLQESNADHRISQWPSLSELNVRSGVDLSFYKEALALLCATGQAPPGGVERLNYLYRDMGNRSKLADQVTLKNDFKEKSWVWDAISNKWRTLDECVWESAIELKCKFALTPTYTAPNVVTLFRKLLEIGNVTLSCLVDELEYMQARSPTELGEGFLDRASALYTLLKDMAQHAGDRKWIRLAFKQKSLIYNRSSGCWLKPNSCIWHATIDIGKHVPIAAMYPDLQEFFVDILGVSTVTSGFMMKQLTTAAARPQKDVNEIKELMLSTSQSLSADNRFSEVEKSVETLLQSQFLPCKSPQGGGIEFRTASETFFILDNQYYGEKFSGKVFMLDFTYEQLISLHELFRVLRLDDHYLTRHVSRETSAVGVEPNDLLTEQFRQCAYAISCCAISHRSSLYSNQNTKMYSHLVSATIQTSIDMSTKLVVEQDSVPVKVVADRRSLLIEHNDDGLSITFPNDQAQRMQCMRSQLPGDLAEILNIYDSRGEKQLYRILNELESGTDAILLQEEISRVSWFPETCRPDPPPPVEEPAVTLQRQSTAVVNGQLEDGQTGAVDIRELERHTRAMSSIAAHSYPDRSPQPFRALPAEPDYATGAVEIRELESHIRAMGSIAARGYPDRPPPPFRALPAEPNHATDVVGMRELESHIRAMSSIAARSCPGRLPPPFRALPAEPDHATDAPLYGKVLEHVRRQAATFRHVNGSVTYTMADDITRAFASLSLEPHKIDPADYPNLFGHDFWLSKFRVGAAGELFVYEILRGLIPGTFGLENWQSKIRHLVQAHEQYTHVTRWTQRETADITYPDQNNSLRTIFRTIPPGDVFADWAPDWLLADNEHPSLEWLFEVKTSLGPCETDFYMSAYQYDLMRQLGDRENDAGHRRQVYCIVRVYNLLSDQIGISFFVDPWRFREGRLEFGTTDKWKVTASSADD